MTVQRPPTIAYDFPFGGLDPFDVTEPRTQHLYYAGGWARAWVAGRPFPEQPRSIHDAIPMGYKALSTIEKLAVVSGGAVLREWSRTDASDRGFRLNADPRVRIGMQNPSWVRPSWTYPFWVMSTTEEWHGFDDYAAALAAATRRATGTWLVGRPLGHDSWH